MQQALSHIQQIRINRRRNSEHIYLAKEQLPWPNKKEEEEERAYTSFDGTCTTWCDTSKYISERAMAFKPKQTTDSHMIYTESQTDMHISGQE